jgi:hypothetical protein
VKSAICKIIETPKKSRKKMDASVYENFSESDSKVERLRTMVGIKRIDTLVWKSKISPFTNDVVSMGRIKLGRAKNKSSAKITCASRKAENVNMQIRNRPNR